MVDTGPYILGLLDKVETLGNSPLYDRRTGRQVDLDAASLRAVGESRLVAVNRRYRVGSPAFLRRVYDIISKDASDSTHLAVGEEIIIRYKKLRRAFPVQAFSDTP